MATASLRALLAGTIDYAGLFPPASLSLEPAVKNYAEYLRTDDAWMLGTFVLPVGQFDDVSAFLNGFDVQHRLRVSALGAKTEHASDFGTALSSTAKAISDFNRRHGAVAGITQIEMPLPNDATASVTQAAEALENLQVPVFFEAPADAAERTIAQLAEHRLATGSTLVGFKLRTGGVIASAFPSSVQIARALVAAVEHRVPIKFTAGLHHPVRQFHSSVQTKMHGFLNVLGAGVLAAEHGWDVQQTARMLEAESSSEFTFSDDAFTWDRWEIATERVIAHRKLVTSLGSCSFDEPREDLRGLNLL
jgi:hypothetical protein